MLGISVIICCYNSQSRIRPTLEHLFAQKTENVLWEIIVVNNNCTDNTVATVWETKEILGFKGELKVVDEPRPGLSFAREKGVVNSLYDYIVFCDDDNWLEPDYIWQAYRLMEKYPGVAILGGQIDPVFETEEPSWFKDYKGGFAVGHQNDVGTEMQYKDWVFGAGMVIKKKFLEGLAENHFVSLLAGRTGSKLMAGDDSEYCYMARWRGYNVAASSLLHLSHFISRSRLTFLYAKQLYVGFGESLPILEFYKDFMVQPDIQPNFRYRIRKINEFCKKISWSRLFFYSLLKPGHPYLSMPHVIMTKAALFAFGKGRALPSKEQVQMMRKLIRPL